MKRNIVILLALTLLAGQPQAQIEGQLGILTPETLAGNNPATGAPWAPGDTYRFAFITSTNPGATLTTIDEYNDLIQDLANASSLNLSDATWKVIGSTADVDARDNTSTNPEEDGTGEAIFLLDGSTVVANDYVDLWDGGIQNIIEQNENGVVRGFLWPFTGTRPDGTASPGPSNSGGPLGAVGEVSQGNGAVTTDWVWRLWTSDPNTTALPLYGLSDPLAIPSGPFLLTITPSESTPETYDFEWASKDGKLYDLVSNTELLTPAIDWPIYDPDGPKGPYQDIPSEGTTTSALGVPASGPMRFFAVVERNPPPPPLQNGSFENPVKADGEFTSVAPPGWTEFDQGDLGEVGVWNPLDIEYATVPDGENVGQVYHTDSVPMTAFGLSQELGAVFAVDTDYQITVEVGRSAIFAWPGYRVELWAGATKIAEETTAAVPAIDSWTTSTVDYSYIAGDAGLAGEPLEIRLLSLGEDPEGAGNTVQFAVEFDDVTFTATGP